MANARMGYYVLSLRCNDEFNCDYRYFVLEYILMRLVSVLLSLKFVVFLFYFEMQYYRRRLLMSVDIWFISVRINTRHFVIITLHHGRIRFYIMYCSKLKFVNGSVNYVSYYCVTICCVSVLLPFITITTVEVFIRVLLLAEH